VREVRDLADAEHQREANTDQAVPRSGDDPDDQQLFE
jgi:hypothetical protein